MKQQQSLLRRTILPLLFAAALVLVCNRVAGSYFIEIEDRYASMVFGGAYGAYDPYVPAIHPLLGQLITLLYRLTPAVNWFGMLLLALVGIAGATAISLAARRPGGLVPGLAILTPILVVLTCSLQSQVVAALCLVSGSLSVLDGFQDGRAGIRRILLGAALCVLGAMLSMNKVWLLTLCVLLCTLVALWRNRHRLALIVGIVLVVAAVALPTLLGTLDSAWQTYHERYMAYESAQQSPLREQVDELLAHYGVEVSIDGGTVTETQEGDAPALTLQEAVARAGFAQSLGWGLNDADLFVRRISLDSQLVAPETVTALNRAIDHFSADGLAGKLWNTLKKMQFLMLLALFLVSALVLVLTNRRRGALALLAAIVALGGHVGMVLYGRTAFCDIAPFYLAGILILLYSYDAEASLEAFRRVVRSKVLRGICAAVALVGFVGCLGGLGYMMRRYNLTESPSVAAAQDLYGMMEKLPDAVFIGDNPLDRYNPNALVPPTVGSDARLLTGSYDLYSPRTEALKAEYGLENPILDAVDREDVLYVDISGANLSIVANRLYDAYGVIIQANVPTVDGEPLINESSQHRMQLYRFVSKTQEEYEKIMEEQQAEQALLDELSEQTGDDVEKIIAYGPSTAPEATPAPEASPSPTPSQP